jgi:hypothetical protein
MVSGDVVEHPLLEGGRKGHQLNVKAQIRRNPAHPFDFARWPDQTPLPRAAKKWAKAFLTLNLSGRLIPSSQIPRSVTVAFSGPRGVVGAIRR